jgi:hypothetical protein
MELRTMIAQNNKTTVMKTAVLALAMLAFVGCQSKQDKAIEQAKKQAAATGQAQQVISVDKSGNTTTTTVQPPVPGQTAQQVTTTVTPAAAVGGVPANTPAVAGGQPCRSRRR